MISRLVPALLGLAAVAVVAVLVVGQTSKDPDYVLYAKFSDAGGILKNYNVKVGSVPAGKVTDITLDDQDNAVVKMELDEGAFPVGQDASAKVRPVNLLGEKYIELNPGDLSKPMPDGSTIQKARTDVPVELDEVINILDPDTRGALRILINEAGVGLMGRGTDFNKTLEELPPAIDSAERVLTEINSENESLERAITAGDRVIGEVNAGRKDFAELVDSAADALDTVAERRQQLGQTVRGAPAAIQDLRTTLTRLQGASTQLTPAARDLRTTAPSLADTLARTPQFAQDAKATLATATRVAPRLTKLGRRSTPTIRELKPTAERLATFTGEAQPLIDTLDTKRGWIDFLGFMDGWAGVTDGADGLGHHFRLRATADLAAIGGLANFVPSLRKQVTKETKKTPAKAPATKPTVPTTGQAPAAPSKPSVTDAVKPVQDGLEQGLKDVGTTVQDVVGGLLGGLTGQGAKQGSTTGSGSSDTTKLFNYLLGP